MYIGIDLGTTSSEACWINNKNEPVVIPSKEGSFGGKNFPSVVAFSDDSDGKILVGYTAKRSPYEKVTQFKRYMGTDWKYHSKTLNRDFTPQELSALVLKKIKEDAEEFLNSEVTGAVVTVPAYFNDNQRQATKDACRIAGLNCVRLVNEPTAACVSYGLGREENARVIVLDLGGGTFDVTVMEIDHGTFQVLSTSGDTQLGGVDLDKEIFNYLVREGYVGKEIDEEIDDKTKLVLMDVIERAKMELSSADSAYIYIPNVVEVTLTREEFDSIIEPVISRLEPPIYSALSDAGTDEIDKVVLVGGATKTPAVRKKFESIFGKDRIVSGADVDPMRAVATGAAIIAAVLEGRWEGDIPLLIDVTPLSLGVEIKGGLFDRIIKRNTPIPVRANKIFTTTQDYQRKVAIRVFQGEREFCKDNTFLGELILDGILPAPAGVPKIEVIFEIDENGILVVTAKDLGTGVSKEIRIEAPHRLSDEEIDRIIEEAKMFERSDRERRKEVELMEKADGLVKAIHNLPEEYRQQLRELENRLKTATGGELEVVVEEAEQKLSEVAKKLYGQSGR